MTSVFPQFWVSAPRRGLKRNSSLHSSLQPKVRYGSLKLKLQMHSMIKVLHEISQLRQKLNVPA